MHQFKSRTLSRRPGRLIRALFLLAVPGLLQAAADDFFIAPTVNWIGPDAATFIWVTESGPPGGEVSVAPLAGGTAIKVEAGSTVPPFEARVVGAAKGTPYQKLEHLRSAATVKGLQPATRYRYEVRLTARPAGGASAVTCCWRCRLNWRRGTPSGADCRQRTCRRAAVSVWPPMKIRLSGAPRVAPL